MATRIEIFRKGRHTATNGTVFELSDKDVRDIVTGYNPALHEAPIVIGHPTDNAPAYGWVQRLAVEGDRIVAEADQVNPSFAESVRSGAFKKRSASFYPPAAPNNPTPGKWALRHVGFLGAVPPAVKGLRDVNFSATAEGSITVELADDEAPAAAPPATGESGPAFTPAQLDALKQLIADALAANPRPAAPAQAAPSSSSAPANLADAGEVIAAIEAVPGLSAELLEALRKAIEAAFALAPPAAQAAAPANLAEAAIRHQQLSAREKDLAARETRLKRDAHASFLDALVREGRPLPLAAPQLVGIMTVLEDARSADFAEPGPTALDAFKAMLGRLPRAVHFREYTGQSTDLSDAEPEVVAKAAVEYQAEQIKKGVVVSTSDAVNHVRGKGR